MTSDMIWTWPYVEGVSGIYRHKPHRPLDDKSGPTGKAYVAADLHNQVLAANAQLAARLADLTAFVAELRDWQPEVISGRRRDPQDDVDDMTPVGPVYDWQAEAKKLLGEANP